jgi:hypothetical protein
VLDEDERVLFSIDTTDYGGEENTSRIANDQEALRVADPDKLEITQSAFKVSAAVMRNLARRATT